MAADCSSTIRARVSTLPHFNLFIYAWDFWWAVYRGKKVYCLLWCGIKSDWSSAEIASKAKQDVCMREHFFKFHLLTSDFLDLFQIFKCKFCGTNYCKACGRGDFHGVMTDSAVCRVCFQVNARVLVATIVALQFSSLPVIRHLQIWPCIFLKKNAQWCAKNLHSIFEALEKQNKCCV